MTLSSVTAMTKPDARHREADVVDLVEDEHDGADVLSDLLAEREWVRIQGSDDLLAGFDRALKMVRENYYYGLVKLR